MPTDMIYTVMEPAREYLKTTKIEIEHVVFHLSLYREDFSAIYPGMERYTVSASVDNETVALFRTNSYEYCPLVSLDAHDVAFRVFSEWEEDIQKNSGDFIIYHREKTPHYHPSYLTDLVIIQGSPRGMGNCSILAQWAVNAAKRCGKTVQVIYPHDMKISGCIGCYQCYNTGTCVYNDDMREIIDAVRAASALVICSPVYTNTVPGGLKLLIDRFQAYHAERTLSSARNRKKGLIFAVAGRGGKTVFTCTVRVIASFLTHIGIEPEDTILIDRIDTIRDIRTIPELEKQVTNAVIHLLTTSGSHIKA